MTNEVRDGSSLEDWTGDVFDARPTVVLSKPIVGIGNVSEEDWSAEIPGDRPAVELSELIDVTRDFLARALVWLLIGTVLSLLALLGLQLAGTFVEDGGRLLKDMAQVIIGPLVALVGSVIGFYFGSQSFVASRGSRKRTRTP